jgi:hypothetical protein
MLYVCLHDARKRTLHLIATLFRHHKVPLCIVMQQPGAGASKYHSGCFSSVVKLSGGRFQFMPSLLLELLRNCSLSWGGGLGPAPFRPFCEEKGGQGVCKRRNPFGNNKNVILVQQSSWLLHGMALEISVPGNFPWLWKYQSGSLHCSRVNRPSNTQIQRLCAPSHPHEGKRQTRH